MIGGLNAHFEGLGLAIAAGFGLCWLGSMALWRWRARRAGAE
jgi:hypothetical protein